MSCWCCHAVLVLSCSDVVVISCWCCHDVLVLWDVTWDEQKRKETKGIKQNEGATQLDWKRAMLNLEEEEEAVQTSSA